jgi:EAL domain-containing protein (putative c-di-GMP-specific phosphodiesterase class I)
MLRELGCGAAQGYLFSKPQPAEAIEKLFSRPLSST